MTPHATLPSACGAALLTEAGRMTLGKRASLDRTLCLPLLPAPTRATPDPVIPKEAAPDYTWRKCTFCHYPPCLSHSYTHTHTPRPSPHSTLAHSCCKAPPNLSIYV